ncbi:MAG: hypothetical protein ACI8YC_001694 [Salibacteraceae bacterium]|jgi:hypothetical protein
MRNRICSFICSLFLVGSLSGQELINISNTLYLHNPAVTGLKGDINFLGQYFGLSHTNIASFHNARFFLEGRLPIFKESTQLNLAAGFAYERDEIGFLTENNWSFSVANHFMFQNESKLSLGISATQRRMYFDNSNVVYPTGPSVGFINIKELKIAHRYSVGGLFESVDKTVVFGGGFSNENANQSGLYRINASLGKAFELGKNFVLSVNTFNEFAFANTSWLIAVPVKIHYKKSFYFGATVATSQYIGAITGARLNYKKVGTFEIGGGDFTPLSKLTNHRGAGAQIFLNYYFTNPEKSESFSYF